MKKQILITLLSITSFVFTSMAQVNYQWVKGMGGENNDIGTSLATDGAGNVYMSANISSNLLANINFDPYNTSSHIFQLANNGNHCAFAKYDDEGNCLWQKSFFSPGISLFNTNFLISRIVVEVGDTAIFVAGAYVNDVDFGGITLNNSSSETPKPFLAKYRASNGNLIWAKDLGQTNGGVTDVAVSPNAPYVFFTVASNIAVFGKCDLANGDTLYTKKISAVGGAVFPSSMALDNSGNITITGSFEGTADFNPDPNQDFILTVNTVDIFVAQYYLGGDFIWAKNFGGPNTDIGTTIAFNATGDTIYLAGTIQNNAEFVSGNPLSVIGEKDGFVAKLNNFGGVAYLQQIKTNTPTDSVLVTSIALDENNSVYIAGLFYGSSIFTAISNPDTLTSNGLTDIFFAKYDAGLELDWTVGIGGETKDVATDIALHNQYIYVTGSFEDIVDFNPAAGIANRVATPGSFVTSDIFFAKYSSGSAKIEGTIYDSNNTALDGTQGSGNVVRLYTQILFDGNQAMNLIAETSINNLGYYEFNQVPAGTYYILAVAGDDYPTLAATYFGDKTRWEESTPLTVVANTNYTKDINMVGYTPPTGNATLSGYVLEGVGFDRIQGEPIRDKDIVLEEDPGNTIISHTETDQNGYYEFTNVPAGCYKIYINITGLPMDSTYKECPTATDSIINLNFIADSSSIYINPTPTSITENTTILQSSIKLYPNPHKGFINTELMLQKDALVKLELYSIVGEKILDLDNETRKQGLVKISINMSRNNVSAGIYFLKVFVDNQEVGTQKIIQTN